MPNNTDERPIHQPRRKDRAQSDAWIRTFLKRAQYGMLATEWQGQPFLKPTLFVYDEATHAIYIHGALEGRMRHNLAANPRLCFCAAEMGPLLPAKTAMEFGVEYASVVVFGRAVVVREEAEACRALQLLLDRYFPDLQAGVDYRQITPQELSMTAVYRIEIEAWSGKERKANPTVED